MGDLHVDTRRLSHRDGLADRLGAAVGLVTDVRGVRGAVAPQHTGERHDLVGVGMAAGRAR